MPCTAIAYRRALGASSGSGADVLYDGLTPTIYAAPSNLGTGSGTSEANAMALQTALATAAGGSIIGMLPGLYSDSSASGDHWRPIYFIENSGSSGAPTIVVGKYDHLLYWNDAAKRCEFRNSLADNTAPWNGANNYPVIGFYGRDYQQWRNLYIDTQYAPAYPSRGTVDSNTANHLLLRKLVWNRTIAYNASEGGADNYDNFFCQASDDVTVEYCYAFGNAGTSIHRNMSVVKFYSTTNFTVQYCTFSGVMMGVFVKGDVLTTGNSGTIAYNRCTGAIWGFIGVGVVRPVAGGANTVDVHHNLGIRNAEDFRFESSGDSGSTNDHRIVRSNTFVDCTGVSSGASVFSNDTSFISEGFYSNVVAYMSSTANMTVDLGGGYGGTGGEISPFNNNLYYEAGGSAQFANGSVSTGIAAWRTATAHEGSSSETDPIFDNAGGDNYKRTASGDTSSFSGGKRGCYETGSEQIGAF